ncbi:MAG: bi-domain-containing oxidoreductase [Elusimicrobia bacterium]|nr:bi-domain-containing oxidoreductase [Elusimicrobiota bacterium]
MRKLLVQNGRVVVADVPGAGHPGEHELKVRVVASAVSSGTESAVILSAGLNLKKYAYQWRKIIQTLRDQGVLSLMRKIEERWSKTHPIGYSAAGIVLACGSEARGFAPGDLVAASGSQFAHHAEEILVSSRLCARVPPTVSPEEAATVTLGAIAINAVRQAGVSLGESVAIVGLGALGQLIAQIAQASGGTVIGLDPDQTRLKFAEERGWIRHAASPNDDAPEKISRWTGGLGADQVIIAAHAPENNELLALAVRLARKRGRVTIVGNVKTDVPRELLYEKDVSINIAVAYGPGRYDQAYETKGVDYPANYVRWTAARNMDCYLDLIAQKTISVAPLIQATYPIERAQEAYAESGNAKPRPLMTLLHYNGSVEAPGGLTEQKRPMEPAPVKIKNKKIRIGIIGAGQFTAGTHIPIIKEFSDVMEIAWICNKHAERALQLAKREGARATASYEDVLNDPSVDLVLIGTRHNLHARLAQEAAGRSKAVFLEKPMATTLDDLENLENAAGRHPGLFHVGFNRRFSPLSIRLKNYLNQMPKPWIINYRVAAEVLPAGHWVLTEEGGGRAIGELCHMIDLVSFLLQNGDGALPEPIGVQARSAATAQYHLTDHMTVNLVYPGGCNANIVYSASRSKDLGKEYIEILSPSGRLRLDDFRMLEVSQDSRAMVKESMDRPNKGLKEQWAALADYLLGRRPAVPMTFEGAAGVTRITFLVDQLLKENA